MGWVLGFENYNAIDVLLFSFGLLSPRVKKGNVHGLDDVMHKRYKFLQICV